FGGQGLYVDDLFIALIAEGKLFLKTSEATRQHFADAGGQPFVYQGSQQKSTVVMSYWTPPAEALESPALMTPWARLAMEAALAARKPSTSRRSTQATQTSGTPRKSGATAKNRVLPSKPATRSKPKTGKPGTAKR
ncbi:TfoX/Sxy family protein, partial [Leptospira sp. 96542]|nr:TfoX/Sxy family protein [Leptospira sp. 96542]